MCIPTSKPSGVQTISQLQYSAVSQNISDKPFLSSATFRFTLFYLHGIPFWGRDEKIILYPFARRNSSSPPLLRIFFHYWCNCSIFPNFHLPFLTLSLLSLLVSVRANFVLSLLLQSLVSIVTCCLRIALLPPYLSMTKFRTSRDWNPGDASRMKEIYVWDHGIM